MPDEAPVLKCDMWSDGWEAESTFWVAAGGQTLEEARQALAGALADWGLEEDGLVIEALDDEPSVRELEDQSCEDCDDDSPDCEENCPHRHPHLVYAFILGQKEDAPYA